MTRAKAKLDFLQLLALGTHAPIAVLAKRWNQSRWRVQLWIYLWLAQGVLVRR